MLIAMSNSKIVIGYVKCNTYKKFQINFNSSIYLFDVDIDSKDDSERSLSCLKSFE